MRAKKYRLVSHSLSSYYLLRSLNIFFRKVRDYLGYLQNTKSPVLLDMDVGYNDHT